MITFWVCVIATAMMLYVLLDGFDLGVGILFALTHNEHQREKMLQSVLPVWDGNETWLVMTATLLFGAFPMVFSAVLSAFYLPLCLMLAGLIFRGVAFEFRHQATSGRRWMWDVAFGLGSLLAALVQGATVGALVHGLPFVDGRYIGNAFEWASPFALVSGVGLVLGYALLGAGWLILKDDGELRARAYRLVPWLIVWVITVLVVVFVYALSSHLPVLNRWVERPWLAAFPAVGAFATVGLIAGLRKRIDWLPFAMTLVLFVVAFGMFAASFWPYMVPFSITVTQAAAPPSTLSFMFWGIGAFIFPLTLIYTTASYIVFRGKVRPALHH